MSNDGSKIAAVYHAAELLDDHHPESKNQMLSPLVVLGNARMTTGRIYWEIEAAHETDDRCALAFGVTSSASPQDYDASVDAASWVVWFSCENAIAAIAMLHAHQPLHAENVTSGHPTHRYGMLLDVDMRSLSVIDINSNKTVYVFANVETSEGVTLIFAVSGKCPLRLVDPNEIQSMPLLSFATAPV